jgi:chromosome segregation ATPase
MTQRGFDANVPARKPRTQIGRVISELASEPRAGQDAEVAPAARDAIAAPSLFAPTVDVLRAPSGREHLARLRERLAAAALPLTTVTEPKHTAAAVRDAVDGLRAKLETAARERFELEGQLEDVRAALARAEADLQRERRARTAVEARAEERRGIADEAVAEAEALAAERDQLIGDLAEQRRRDDEQVAMLAEVEAVLARHDAERDSTARDVADARTLADLRAADVADLEARLQAECAARERVQARCRELETEVARLSEAREALQSIEAMVKPGR